MDRTEYYEQMKDLARRVRHENGLCRPRVLKSDMKRLYKAFGIKIERWPYKFKKLRGAYFNDDLGPTVVIASNLPPDPFIFTMAHELKHHLEDRDLALSYCDLNNQNEHLEIGAEVFAAELLFPQQDFLDLLISMGITKGKCTPEAIVRLKHNTGTTLSYTGLAKRAEFLGLATNGSLQRVMWKKLEESIYGVPIYKRILKRRQCT